MSENNFYNSPREISKLLKSLEIAPRKIWGQNYLINQQLREKIVESIEIEENDTLWEIGPGLGSLTVLALKKCSKLIAFEIDLKYSAFLREKFKDEQKFKLFEGDFLKTFKSEREIPNKIFSNLPYNIASQVISTLITNNILVPMVLTLQKELAERALSLSGRKNYSAFSVLTQAYFNTEAVIDIAQNNFYPAPKVLSSVLKFKPKKSEIKNFKVFNSLVRTLFSQRRKKIKNTIKNFFLQNNIKDDNLVFLKEYLEKRPEELEVNEFIQIANNFNL